MTTVRLLVRTLTPAPSAIPYGLQAVSGGLFVALLFAGSAAAGALALLQDIGDAPYPGPTSGVRSRASDTRWCSSSGPHGRHVAITTTTLLLHAGLLPRWVALLSYLMAAGMLVTATFHPALLLVFPGWVALASLIVLVRTGRSGARISSRSRP
jgi:hypothetical protein